MPGRVGEIQRVALVRRLKLLPVKENAVGQPVDAPPARRLDQFDRTGIGQRTLAGLEHSDIRERAEDVGAHVDRNPIGAARFDEHHVVDQQGATGVVPCARGGFGEELPRGQMPVGGIGGRLEEFAQQHVGIHARRRLRQARRRGPVDGADGLRRRRTGHPGATRKNEHQQPQPPPERVSHAFSARVHARGPCAAAAVRAQRVSSAAGSSSPCGRAPAAG